MPKHAKRGATVDVDPAVSKVQSNLEENLTYFMSNIGQFIKKFDDCLTGALPSNPKSQESKEQDPEAQKSPLLKRELVAMTQPPSERPRPKVEVTENEDEISILFPANDELRKQLQMIKREAYELGTTFDGIHDWIALNIPDLKEEDNAGVEVMGAVIEQTTSLIDSVRGVYSLELKYLSDRSDCEKSLLKVPDSRSLQLQLESVDADMWDEIERAWRTLIRVCLILYSVLAKNMQKLREPRSRSNAHMMM